MVEYIKEDIQEVMQITGLTETKAEKLFKSVANDLDDGTDDELCSYDVIEVIKLEHKANETGANNKHATATVKAERKPKERKVDNEKLGILQVVAEGLASENIETAIEKETKIHFAYNGADYTLMLTKHRAKKEK